MQFIMKRCLNCKTLLSISSRVCTKCGSKKLEKGSYTDEPRMSLMTKCDSCGKMICSDKPIKCPFCGKSFIKEKSNICPTCHASFTGLECPHCGEWRCPE